jgi:hypothetical protein
MKLDIKSDRERDDVITMWGEEAEAILWRDRGYRGVSRCHVWLGKKCQEIKKSWIAVVSSVQMTTIRDGDI